jgi:hypothetical protein
MSELYWKESRFIKVGSNIVRLDDVTCMVGEDYFTTLYFRNGESVDINTTIDELWGVINGG